MKTFTFVFTEEELNQIFNALSDKPYKEVVGLLNNITNQYRFAMEEEQRKIEAKAEAEKKDVEKTEKEK